MGFVNHLHIERPVQTSCFPDLYNLNIVCSFGSPGSLCFCFGLRICGVLLQYGDDNDELMVMNLTMAWMMMMDGDGWW